MQTDKAICMNTCAHSFKCICCTFIMLAKNKKYNPEFYSFPQCQFVAVPRYSWTQRLALSWNAFDQGA